MHARHQRAATNKICICVLCEGYVLAIFEQIPRSDILSETCKAKLGAKNILQQNSRILWARIEHRTVQRIATYGFGSLTITPLAQQCGDGG